MRHSSTKSNTVTTNPAHAAVLNESYAICIEGNRFLDENFHQYNEPIEGTASFSDKSFTVELLHQAQSVCPDLSPKLVKIKFSYTAEEELI